MTVHNIQLWGNECVCYCHGLADQQKLRGLKIAVR